jgi:hypothetical protein
MKYLFIVSLLLRFDTATAQQVIAQWNFDTPLAPDFSLITGSTTPSMGNGFIRLVGNAAPSVANPFNDGSDNDYFTNGLDNTGWNITRFPAQGTASKTAGYQIAVNTAGYNNIKLKFDEKHSNSAANTTVVQYNPDTLNTLGWVDIQVNKVVASPFSADWLTHQVDLSGLATVNNQPRLGLRVVAAFDPADGFNYISTLTQTAATYNATGGTIRLDMITVTGTPITGCSLPNVQASAVTWLPAPAGQIKFSFNRGSGDGVLILCREGYAVNKYPDAGTAYTAAATFGSGNQVGTGNYVVYNSVQPGRNTLSISNLTSGKVYYFAAFEYSLATLCYLQPPLYFHAACGGTVFKPGELLLLGFDTRIPGAGTGNDKIFVSSLVDILPGTQFSLVSSRYEAGAAPNVRTNRWYNSGDYINKDPDVQEFTWTGSTSLSAGTIIGIQDKFNVTDRYDSVSVNGVYEPLLVSDKQKGAFNIPTATTKGEQFYLVQGSFYPVGDFYTDRYNMLFGKPLFGMTLLTNWVAFAATPGTANAGIGFRESRIPPEILCLNIANLSDTVGSAVNKAVLVANKRDFKQSFANVANWQWRVGDAAQNIVEDYSAPYTGELGQPLLVLPTAATEGTWVGDKNNDWFNCGNWEGLAVPDSLVDVKIDTVLNFAPLIVTNTGQEPAVLYGSLAHTQNLNMASGAAVTVAAGSALKVFGNLVITSVGGRPAPTSRQVLPQRHSTHRAVVRRVY